MATLVFYPRTSKKNPNNINLNLRFSWSRETPFRKSLGIEVPLDSWDAKKQRIKNVTSVYKYRHIINKELEEFEDWFENYFKLNKIINKEKLAKDFDLYRNPVKIDDSFNSFVRNYVINVAPFEINKKTKKRLSNNTLKGYKTVIGHLDKFDAGLTWDDINIKFYNDFVKYCETDNICLNTVGGYVRRLKTFIGKSDKDIDLSDFHVTVEDTYHVALNEEEINKIYQYDYSDNKRYDNIRNWLIIGCWTALRVSDWERFIKIEDGFTTIKAQKTNNTVVIPIHWMVEEIIKEKGIPYMVSDVEFNRVIKLVCGDVGISNKVYGSRRSPKTNRKETGMFKKHLLISSHTGRRSFATNMYNAKVPILSIMAITGHKTIKSFLTYIKITPKEHAEKVKEHWDRYYSKKG